MTPSWKLAAATLAMPSMVLVACSSGERSQGVDDAAAEAAEEAGDASTPVAAADAAIDSAREGGQDAPDAHDFGTDAGPIGELLLTVPFQPGVTHINGKYRFTDDNVLLEGAKRAQSLGAKALFTYLTPQFRAQYPDVSSTKLWPATDPSSLKALIATEPYKQLLDLPFRTHVFTTFGFANGENVFRPSRKADLAITEEQELYDLTKYLLTTYRGKDKIFVLKHWEGDWFALRGFDATQDITTANAEDMIAWLSARQKGVTRARTELGPQPGVAVYLAVEVNRVFDAEAGKHRMLNDVVPKVSADLVTYSSYDATVDGADDTKDHTKARLAHALSTIDSFAPDPLKLGKRRIFISEFGLVEQEAGFTPSVTWRTEAILEASKEFGLAYAFHWELFDNECKDASGADTATIAFSLTDPKRPKNANCRGFWLIRPDGTDAIALPTLKSYWSKL